MTAPDERLIGWPGAGVTQLVECNVANVVAAGSSPVSRSTLTPAKVLGLSPADLFLRGKGRRPFPYRAIPAGHQPTVSGLRRASRWITRRAWRSPHPARTWRSPHPRSRSARPGDPPYRAVPSRLPPPASGLRPPGSDRPPVVERAPLPPGAHPQHGTQKNRAQHKVAQRMRPRQGA